jgi:D-xylose reductase
MEDLVDAGLAKNIGVRSVPVFHISMTFRSFIYPLAHSNVASALLRDVHTYARYEPQVLQIEHHPYLTQEPLIQYAKDTIGIAITAYTSFGPQSFIELNADKGVKSLLAHEKISEIAHVHGKSI